MQQPQLLDLQCRANQEQSLAALWTPAVTAGRLFLFPLIPS